MRCRWILHPLTGRLVPAEEYRRPEVQRSSLPTPQLIRDTMDPTWNPLNGRIYDSKSRYKDEVRARGGHIVGNDIPVPTEMPDYAPTGVAEDIKRAYDMLDK